MVSRYMNEGWKTRKGTPQPVRPTAPRSCMFGWGGSKNVRREVLFQHATSPKHIKSRELKCPEIFPALRSADSAMGRELLALQNGHMMMTRFKLLVWIAKEQVFDIRT